MFPTHDLHWFEILTRDAVGVQAAVLAKSAIEAHAEATALLGRDVIHAFDAARIPDGVELLYAGRGRFGCRTQREWLLRVSGVEVHVYEDFDTMFPQCRFRANIPGRGTADWRLAGALYVRSYFEDLAAQSDPRPVPDWFTQSVRAGRCYYPTSYVP